MEGGLAVAAEHNRLVREGLPVLEHVARRIAKRMGGHIEVDDLIALGHPALLEVARTYDPSRAAFSAYAAIKVKWAILDGLRREIYGRAGSARWVGVIASERLADAMTDAYSSSDEGGELLTEDIYRERLSGVLNDHAAALALGFAAGSSEAGGSTLESPEDNVARAELRRAMSDAIRALPDRERALIERHYYGGEPFDAIAKELGISKSWASRLHAQAIRALADSLHSSV